MGEASAISGSIWGGIKSVFEKETYQVMYGIISGRISIKDIAAAFGKDIADAVKYQADNYEHVVNGKPSRKEAYKYGVAHGKVISGVFALTQGTVLLTKVTTKAILKVSPSIIYKFKKLKVNVNDLKQNPLDEFDFYGGNYNREALRAAREYIKEHKTIAKPIDVKVLSDGTMIIQDGHHRWWAAKQMGLNEVPIKVVK